MKKSFIISAAVIVLALAGTFYYISQQNFTPPQDQQNQQPDPETPEATWSKYENKELGLIFEYRQSPDGYVLQDPGPGTGEHPDFLKTFVLMKQKDYEDLQKDEGGREGPPSINILVFKREGNSLIDWLRQNSGFTNFSGDIESTYEITGKPALAYSWDGLYQGRSVAVMSDNHIYLVAGTYFEPRDSYYNDFNELIETLEISGTLVEQYRTTLAGEYVCLPPVDPTQPSITQCVFGIKLDNGSYYAIDFLLMSQAATPLEVGYRLSANGLVTPIERLSTDQWRAYPVKGIFSVTDSVRVIK